MNMSKTPNYGTGQRVSKELTDIRQLSYKADGEARIAYYGDPQDAQAKVIRDKIFADLIRNQVIDECAKVSGYYSNNSLVAKSITEGILGLKK